MDSILICEGSTDYILLQYYMREALQWVDNKDGQKNLLTMKGQKSRKLFKGFDTLTIMATGGCSRLTEGLKCALNRNRLSQPDLSGAFTNIVIVTDRDEVDTEEVFIESIKQSLKEYDIGYPEQFHNNEWISCKMKNAVGVLLEFKILILVIPFEEQGAMETFLLNAVAENDHYDRDIIEQCRDFVDKVDAEKRYLKNRRLITKAKFDTYFSVRTPAEQFVERSDILKSVRWEEYTKLQVDFALLAAL